MSIFNKRARQYLAGEQKPLRKSAVYPEGHGRYLILMPGDGFAEVEGGFATREEAQRYLDTWDFGVGARVVDTETEQLSESDTGFRAGRKRAGLVSWRNEGDVWVGETPAGHEIDAIEVYEASPGVWKAVYISGDREFDDGDSHSSAEQAKRAAESHPTIAVRKQAKNPQSGHGESELETPEVPNEHDPTAMWPWEIDESEEKEAARKQAAWPTEPLTEQAFIDFAHEHGYLPYVFNQDGTASLILPPDRKRERMEIADELGDRFQGIWDGPNTGVMLKGQGALITVKVATRRKVSRKQATVDPDYLRMAQDKFAWPGGYEIFFVTDDGGVLCYDCVAQEWDDTIRDAYPGDGWYITGTSHTGEIDDVEMCDHCGRPIPKEGHVASRNPMARNVWGQNQREAANSLAEWERENNLPPAKYDKELYRNDDGHEVWRIVEIGTGQVYQEDIGGDFDAEWILNSANYGLDVADRIEDGYLDKPWFMASKQANESDPPHVEVGDEDDRPMWPTELEGDPDTGEDAADVAGTPTPGQSVADYPQQTEQTPEEGELPAQASKLGKVVVHYQTGYMRGDDVRTKEFDNESLANIWIRNVLESRPGSRVLNIEEVPDNTASRKWANQDFYIGERVLIEDGLGDTGLVEYWDGGWFVRLDDGELTGPWDDGELSKTSKKRTVGPRPSRKWANRWDQVKVDQIQVGDTFRHVGEDEAYTVGEVFVDSTSGLICFYGDDGSNQGCYESDLIVERVPSNQGQLFGSRTVAPRPSSTKGQKFLSRLRDGVAALGDEVEVRIYIPGEGTKRKQFATDAEAEAWVDQMLEEHGNDIQVSWGTY